jgi:immune inhibitor A
VGSNSSGTQELTAKVLYDIEEDWDYAYIEVDGTPVYTSESTTYDPNEQNVGSGITGDSGGWKTLTADLSAFAGQNVQLGFRYRTDSFVTAPGIFLDDITINGVLLDGAETEGSPAWIFDGFYRRESGPETNYYFNAYIAEYRTYRGSDKYSETGPYSFYSSEPDQVDHFPLQDGLLVWYWDQSFTDNEVFNHCSVDGRCGGFLLPVDAHPDLIIEDDGWIAGGRIQGFDSTFSLEDVDRVSISTFYSTDLTFGDEPGNPVFDDTQEYWNPPDDSIGNYGHIGVDVPKTGTTIQVVNTNAHRNFMEIRIN